MKLKGNFCDIKHDGCTTWLALASAQQPNWEAVSCVAALLQAKWCIV